MGHRRALVIAVVALLAVGLVWGLGSALAGSESPSPAAGKTVLHLGWTNDPDNLNPFIGYKSTSYEIWVLTQQTTLDLQQRIALVHRMQQIVYDALPYIVLVYPDELEAYDHAQFTGWQRSLHGKGKVWFDVLPGLYMNIQKADVAAAGGGSSTGLIVGLVIAAIVVLAIIVLLVRRRGGRSEVEA